MENTGFNNDSYVAKKTELIATNYTLKILFGPMYGCDLTLPADNYFIHYDENDIVSFGTTAPLTESIHAGECSDNIMLYIPSNLPSPNITLCLANNAESTTTEHKAFIHSPSGMDELTISENKIFSYENLCFALKKSSENWSENLLSHEKIVTTTNEIPKAGTNITLNKNNLLLSISLAILFIFSAACFLFYNNRADHQIVSLQESLSSAPGEFHIIPGNEGKVYIFTYVHQTLAWINQALYKLNRQADVTVLSEKKSREDILNLLLKNGIPVLNINLKNPTTPLISLYDQGNQISSEVMISAFREVLPFVQKIEITRYEKQDVISQARQGLDKLHVFYREVETTKGYSFIIHGAINDSTLSSLKKFISEYRKDWGSNLVNFSVNLNDDLLKDKSYLDAKNGYLFLNPNHWYFPTN